MDVTTRAITQYIVKAGPVLWFGGPAVVCGIVWAIRGFYTVPYGGGTHIGNNFSNGWLGLMIGSSMGVTWIISFPTYFCISCLS